MTLKFAPDETPSLPLLVLESAGFDEWLSSAPERVAAWLQAIGFKARLGEVAVIPDENGRPKAAYVGYGTASERQRGRFALAHAPAKLPAGTYHLQGGVPQDSLNEEALGWMLSGYRFGRYKTQPEPNVFLKAPGGVDAKKIEILAAGEALTRDLINTPASDMGPDALETQARELAREFAAEIDVTVGNSLLENNFPMIHAVGRASDRDPRLIDLRWGSSGPKLTLVGKGVCFDTGGLNLKPGSSMGLMKKDMGGAATVLGLARMIMLLDLPVQLRVLVPAVENSVSGSAFRPQDILTSRKGLTVEINNTDAEGRLVLADALTLADEDNPDLLVSMATLTGAARVAVGPDLAPFYCGDDRLADALAHAGRKMADPVWRLPFWDPYETMIEPGIADLDNAPSGGFAGSITAALFLRRFVENAEKYVHFDIYGWQPNAAPARPKGGVGQGARAILGCLPEVLKL